MICRSRSFANWMFRMQPRVHTIGRPQMIGFRVDINPWSEKRLRVFQANTHPYNIVSGAAKDEFDMFLTAFRVFAGADSNNVIPEFKDIWTSPIRRGLVAAVAITGLLIAVSSFAIAKISREQLGVAFVGVVVAYAGTRFLIRRS